MSAIAARRQPVFAESRRRSRRIEPWRFPLVAALVAVLVALLAGVATAQNAGGAADQQLSGQVTDASGRAVAAAEVWIPELERSVLTDANGAFRITGLPAGRYTVAVRRLGYAPRVQSLELRGAATLDVTLEATPFVLEPVIVTGTPVPLAPGHVTWSSAVLSGDALRRQQTVSLAHAIEGLPGVRTLSTGAQVGKPVIRGLAGPRVLVLDDGRRLEDYSWSDEDGPSIDARQVQRVEVIRGPASVLYGSDALGGVVNAVPADLPESIDGRPVLHLGYEAYGASNNREIGGALRLEGASGRFGWRALGIGRGSGDLRTPDGKLGNTGFFAGDGEGVVGVRGRTGNATLRYVRYGGEFKLLEIDGPPPTAGEAQKEEGPERKLSDDRVQLGANYFVSGLWLETRAQWQRHNLIEVADDPNAPAGTKTESEQFNLLLDTGSLDLVAHHGGQKWSGAFGVSGLEQANDTRGPIPLVPDAHVAAGAAYIFEQLRLGRVDLLAGARTDLRHLDADPNAVLHLAEQSRNDTQVSGNVGVVVHALPALALAANVGQAWRAPTLFELYTYGPHLGDLRRWEIGDPGLRPEKGLAVDASLRWENARVRAELAGFRNQMRDFIFIQSTGQFHLLPSGDRLEEFEYDQAQAVLQGTELGAEVIAQRHLTLRGRFDYVRGQNEDIDKPLPLIPPARGALGFGLHWSVLGWADEAKLGAEVEGVARQTRLSAFDTSTAPYALLHLDGGLERHWHARLFRVDLSLRNVANVRHRDFLSRYKAFAIEQGRNILLRVSTGI